jgi:NTE family protein
LFIVRALAVAVALSACGCAAFPKNPPLTDRPLGQGYRYAALDAAANEDAWSKETLVFLSFSGGGTRAAAFAYGALDQLRRTCILVDGRPRSLLDEVDIISSNSGGSYAAAYYGLFRDATFKDRVTGCDGGPRPADAWLAAQDPPIENFEDRFLRKPFQTELILNLVNPYQLARILSPYFSRTDRAAEIVDEIFYEKTFADLASRGKPFVNINAHDTSFGSRFPFTQEYFDLMCADLSAMPVGRAVMASSAVHGAFRSIRLVNFGGQPCWPDPRGVDPRDRPPPDLKIDDALAEGTRNSNFPRYLEARRLQQYRYGHCWPYAGDELAACLRDQSQPLTVHLNDGGAVDNLGLDTLNDFLGSDLGELNAFGELQTGRIKRLIVIVVDARNAQDIEQIERSTDGSGIEDAAQGLDAAIDAKSNAAVALLDSQLTAWTRIQEGMEIQPMVLIRTETMEERNDRIRLQGVECIRRSVGTTFELSDAQIDAVVHAGRQATYESGALRQIVEQFGGVAPPVAAMDYCQALGIRPAASAIQAFRNAGGEDRRRRPFSRPFIGGATAPQLLPKNAMRSSLSLTGARRHGDA